MRIAIPIIGTRGDVQPFVALGAGLRSAGHDACLVTHDDFAGMIRAAGLAFAPLGGSARALHSTSGVRRLMEAGADTLTYLREFARIRRPIMGQLMADCLAGCRGADLVLVTPTAPLIAISVAEKLRLPICGSAHMPNYPSRYLASCFVPELPAWVPGRALYNAASSTLVAAYLWHALRHAINRAREGVLGLPPLGLFSPPFRWLRHMPTLHAYSSRLVARPTDWTTDQIQTGFWFLDSDGWVPPPDLERFLAAGPPPVYVGFGSMLHRHATAFTGVVKAALRRAGARGVLARGWGALGGAENSDDVFVTDAVPHDWLFHRVAAVVHHGGVGTTAAGLRAGAPSVVVPFFGDQYFWGRRVHECGAGPPPIPRRELTSDRLAGALGACLRTPAVRASAQRLGAALRAEDGVGRAVEAIERIAHRPTPYRLG